MTKEPYQWFHRAGIDPWMMSACEAHGAELVELGFERGRSPHHSHFRANLCPFCKGITSMDDVRNCACNELGVSCSVHRDAPAGSAGERARVRCNKCAAELQVPADRIAFRASAHASGSVVAVDVTGWAERNGDGPELRCPFHGSIFYYLERVEEISFGHPADRDEHMLAVMLALSDAESTASLATTRAHIGRAKRLLHELAEQQSERP